MFFTALTFLCLLLPGCSETSPDQEKEKVLKIGILGPFTGRTSTIGEEFKGAVEMAFEKVDYRIGDYDVEFFWIDSQSDPERATLAYEKAATQDEIDVCILNWHSSVAVAAMDVAARNRLPHFFGFGGTDVINEKFDYDPEYYSYFMAKSWPVPDKLTGTYIEALEQAINEGLWQPGNRRVAIYGEDSDWGRSFGRAIMADFEKAGWEIAGEEYFPAGATDLVYLVSRINSMDAAVIAGSVATAPSFAAFINEVRNSGSQSLIIADGLGWVGEWYELTGPNSNYILDQVSTWTTDEAKAFAFEFETRYGFTPSTATAGLAYDKVSFFIKIAEAALAEYGELSRETLYRYSRENLWTGKISFTEGIIMKEYRYSPDTIPDPIAGENYFVFPVVQYFDGKAMVIWPETWKEADFIAPANSF
jgi:branched-chain amino acid transport system substrate-binding protein